MNEQLYWKIVATFLILGSTVLCYLDGKKLKIARIIYILISICLGLYYIWFLN